MGQKQGKQINPMGKNEGFSNTSGIAARVVGSLISTACIWFLSSYLGITKLPDSFWLGVFVIIFITQCTTFIF